MYHVIWLDLLQFFKVSKCTCATLLCNFTLVYGKHFRFQQMFNLKKIVLLKKNSTAFSIIFIVTDNIFWFNLSLTTCFIFSKNIGLVSIVFL